MVVGAVCSLMEMGGKGTGAEVGWSSMTLALVEGWWVLEAAREAGLGGAGHLPVWETMQNEGAEAKWCEGLFGGEKGEEYEGLDHTYL